MNATIVGEKPRCRIPARERLLVWYKNWKVRHIGKALRVLTKAMRDDPDFRNVWHANIAMPIFDQLASEGMHDHLALTKANKCGDRLMKHLFDA